MPDTSVASANNVEQWAAKAFAEFVRANPFKSVMGTSSSSVIQVGEDLSRKPGDAITHSFVAALTGDGVTNDNTLRGSEEALGNYGQRVTVTKIRNAVVVGDHESIKSAFDLLEAGREAVKLWHVRQTRDLIIQRMVSPVTDGLTTYDAATTTERNTWSTTNNPATTNQRILYGAAKGNWSGVHATDLGNIDGTADDMHQDIVRLGKRLAQACSPSITPVVESSGGNAGKEQFVMFMGSIPFRDLKANMDTIFSQADVRGDENQIFNSSDVRIDNVICKEVPEMDRTTANKGALLENVGAGGTVEVGITALCGAQSFFYDYAERMRPISDSDDYDNVRGVGIKETRGCVKAIRNSFMNGVVQVFVSAVGD